MVYLVYLYLYLSVNISKSTDYDVQNTTINSTLEVLNYLVKTLAIHFISLQLNKMLEHKYVLNYIILDVGTYIYCMVLTPVIEPDIGYSGEICLPIQHRN